MSHSKVKQHLSGRYSNSDWVRNHSQEDLGNSCIIPVWEEKKFRVSQVLNDQWLSFSLYFFNINIPLINGDKLQDANLPNVSLYAVQVSFC